MLAAQSFWEASTDVVRPSLRIGVTGLARSGKTVFTTALLHHLINPGRLPAFRAASEGRIARARLLPQPDDDVPRFPYEQNLNDLRDHRLWPQSTRQISEVRIGIDYERKSRWRSGPASLTLDLVDYPGEWLTDLALLETSFQDWSRETVAAARASGRGDLSKKWLAVLEDVDGSAPADEGVIQGLSEAFKSYLLALRSGPEAVALHPPGRFLMPGDLEGSPALTFSPLVFDDATVSRSSYAGLMERRFESYKSRVARPFFQNHFSRIDRQIVLVDVLAAVDAGPVAMRQLEDAFDRILSVFRVGRNSLFSRLFAPRAEKILFAATKADHLHHESHDRLEKLLRLLVGRAMQRHEMAGAQIGVVALASVRSTRETLVTDRGLSLKAVAGTPEKGEKVDGDIFDGLSDAAIFPGDLPERVESILNSAISQGSLRFPRFRPPLVQADAGGRMPSLPHIRLDRAMEFLMGDCL
jgi:uncharacterized protein